MFTLPAATRLKRSELFDDDPTDFARESEGAQAHEEAEAAATSYGFEYDFLEQPAAEPSEQDTVLQKVSAEDVYHFNLFRPLSKSVNRPPGGIAARSLDQTEAHVVSIRSPSPIDTAEPGNFSFTRIRPDAYYFTASLPSKTLKSLQESYSQSAITSDALFSLRKQSWPGMSLPWRVIQLPTNRAQIVVHKPGTSLAETTKIPTDEHSDIKPLHRSRPSKKRRDLLRKKALQKQRIIDKTKTKEEHEREKRNRKNRERKLKRRAKERKEKEQRKAAGTSPISDQPAPQDHGLVENGSDSA